jgi:hypothetical protein
MGPSADIYFEFKTHSMAPGGKGKTMILLHSTGNSGDFIMLVKLYFLPMDLGPML